MAVTGRAQLRRLIDDFGKLPPELRKELRPAIRKAAQPVLGSMRSNASWSSRIPSATRVSTSLTRSRAGVRIVVNSRRAPHARPYEGVNGRVFRHPPWGHRDRRWIAQRARPFFFRAVDHEAQEVAEAVGDVIPEVARRHGWRG